MATDSEKLEQLRKSSEKKVATSTSRAPWKENMSRSGTVPASKSLQAAEVISGTKTSKVANADGLFRCGILE